uniref:8.9 kDa family member n=1 Tax=Rhipicephalus zambeziensis TaxID=60191 RepID=A0A224Y1A6_9ACAR
MEIKMAKLHACFVIITAVTLFLPDVSQQAIQYEYALFKNGMCQFNGDSVNVKQSVNDIKNCMRWTCYRKNSTHGLMQGASCGVVVAAPPCKVTPRTTGKYAECCPRIVCP